MGKLTAFDWEKAIVIFVAIGIGIPIAIIFAVAAWLMLWDFFSTVIW